MSQLNLHTKIPPLYLKGPNFLGLCRRDLLLIQDLRPLKDAFGAHFCNAYSLLRNCIGFHTSLCILALGLAKLVLLLKPYWLSAQNPKKLAVFVCVFVIAGSNIINFTGYRLVTGDYCDYVITNLLYSQWGIEEIIPDSNNYPEFVIIMLIAFVLHIVSACLIWKKKVFDKLTNRDVEDKGVIVNCLVIPVINMPMILPEIKKETVPVPKRSKDRGVIMNSLIIPVYKFMSEVYEVVSESPGIRSHKDDDDLKNSDKDLFEPEHNEIIQSMKIPKFSSQHVSEEVDISIREALKTELKEVPMTVIEPPDIKSQRGDDDLKTFGGDCNVTVNDLPIRSLSMSSINIQQVAIEYISTQEAENILRLDEEDGTVSEIGHASTEMVSGSKEKLTPDEISIANSVNCIHDSTKHGDTGPQGCTH